MSFYLRMINWNVAEIVYFIFIYSINSAVSITGNNIIYTYDNISTPEKLYEHIININKNRATPQFRNLIQLNELKLGNRIDRDDLKHG